MKKIKILFLVLSAMTFAYSARSQAQLGLGIKAGINVSSLDGTSNLASLYESRTGYHFGAYFIAKFTKLAIQPEILFSQQGTTFKVNSTTFSSNYDYITVPVMVKFYLIGGLNLQGGVQFGFLSSASGDVINSSTGQATTGQDLSNFVNSTDVSVPVGIGFDLPFGLNLTARYNIGVSDVNKYTGSSAPPALISAMGTNQAKSQVFQFSVGFRLFKFGS